MSSKHRCDVCPQWHGTNLVPITAVLPNVSGLVAWMCQYPVSRRYSDTRSPSGVNQFRDVSSGNDHSGKKWATINRRPNHGGKTMIKLLWWPRTNLRDRQENQERVFSQTDAKDRCVSWECFAKHQNRSLEFYSMEHCKLGASRTGMQLFHKKCFSYFLQMSHMMLTDTFILKKIVFYEQRSAW